MPKQECDAERHLVGQGDARQVVAPPGARVEDLVEDGDVAEHRGGERDHDEGDAGGLAAGEHLAQGWWPLGRPGVRPIEERGHPGRLVREPHRSTQKSASRA